MDIEKVVSCECGSVKMRVIGDPFYNSACHCDDCQAGWGYIQQLEGAPPIVDERGGIPFLFYREDQVTFTEGEELLRTYKLKPDSPTERVYASCCNSAMFSKRVKSHFFGLVSARFGSDAPPLERNHFTKFSTQRPFEAGDLPSDSGVPTRLVLKLIAVELGSLFRR